LIIQFTKACGTNKNLAIPLNYIELVLKNLDNYKEKDKFELYSLFIIPIIQNVKDVGKKEKFLNDFVKIFENNDIKYNKYSLVLALTFNELGNINFENYIQNTDEYFLKNSIDNFEKCLTITKNNKKLSELHIDTLKNLIDIHMQVDIIKAVDYLTNLFNFLLNLNMKSELNEIINIYNEIKENIDRDFEFSLEIKYKMLNIINNDLKKLN
jgi:hypothetical protein